MSLRRNFPVPLRRSRKVLRRGLPAFIRPYLLLIFGSAILLSFVVVRSSLNSDADETVETAHSSEALVDRPPPQSSIAVPEQQPLAQAEVEATPTATPTETPPPTATPIPTPTPTPEPTPAVEDLNATTNVLILGSDRRPKEPNWRTDVIILLMMNPNLGEAAIISFPRDMYIDYIPGHQPNRINVIDYLGEMEAPGGGPNLLITVLEQRLGIEIDHYVRFQFDGFTKLIDELGGLRIYVDCHLFEDYPEEGIYLNLLPGEHLPERATGAQLCAQPQGRRRRFGTGASPAARRLGAAQATCRPELESGATRRGALRGAALFGRNGCGHV